MASRYNYNINAHVGPTIGRFEVDVRPAARAKEAAARDMLARYASRARVLQTTPVDEADRAIAEWLSPRLGK